MEVEDTLRVNSGASSEVLYDRSLAVGRQFMKLLPMLGDPVRTHVTRGSNGNISVAIVGSGTPNVTLAWTTSSLQEVYDVLKICQDLCLGSFAKEMDYNYFALAAIWRKLKEREQEMMNE